MVTFNVFRIIGGVGVGLCSIASPLYIAEVSPPERRGALGFMYQLAIVVGCIVSIVSACLLAGNLPAETSWRWMFGSQMVAILVFMVFLVMIPETMLWLTAFLPVMLFPVLDQSVVARAVRFDRGGVLDLRADLPAGFLVWLEMAARNQRPHPRSHRRVMEIQQDVNHGARSSIANQEFPAYTLPAASKNPRFADKLYFSFVNRAAHSMVSKKDCPSGASELCCPHVLL